MRPAIKLAIVAALSAGSVAAVSVFAHGWDYGGGYGMHGGRGPMMRSGGWGPAQTGPAFKHGGANLDSHKTELKLQPGQEGAWQKYADAVKRRIDGMQGLHHSMHSGSADPATLHQSMFSLQRSSWSEISSARDELYAGLSSEQKAAFDRWSRPMWQAQRGGATAADELKFK